MARCPVSLRPFLHGLEPYTPGEQLDGAGITKLNTNENPYPPSPAVQQALDSFVVDGLRRYPPPTADPLRAALADLKAVEGVSERLAQKVYDHFHETG